MRTFILSCALALGSLSTFAQGYQFTDVVKVPATPVKNQASTGTCWCFATTSFMESELLRMGKGTYDLSEMFIVRQKYMNQLQDNYVRQGRGNIGQGSLSHTFMNAFNQVGIVPEEVYSGINYDSDRHNPQQRPVLDRRALVDQIIADAANEYNDKQKEHNNRSIM